MPRYFVLAVLVLALIFTSPVIAADKPSGDNANAHAGGLTCFTVEPQPDPKASVNCNDLCGAKGAACTGVTSNFSPPLSCETQAGKNWETCRCCAISR